MRRWRIERAVVSIAVVTLLIYAGCTANVRVTPISEMTPKQKSAIAMATYNRLAETYTAKSALLDLSAAEKKILRMQYDVLKASWPAIKAYDDYVQGVTSTVDQAIVRQVDAFLATYRY